MTGHLEFYDLMTASKSIMFMPFPLKFAVLYSRFIYQRCALILMLGTLAISSGCDDDDAIQPAISTLNIGVMIPLSGNAASTGESVSAALTIAHADLDGYLESIGSDLDIKLRFIDTGADPSTSQDVLEELHDEGIQYVIGPYSSADVAATLDFANANDILILSPASVASSLAIENDNCYRLVPSDKNQAVAVKALFVHDDIQTIIPIVRNDVWGEGLISDVNDELTTEGITLRNTIFYDPSNMDVEAISQKVSDEIDAAAMQTPLDKIGVYLLSFGEGTEVLQAASQFEANASVNWYGSSAYANNNSLINDSEARAFATEQKLLCPSFAPDPSVEDLWGPIESELIALLGRTPETYALTSYDALWVITMSYLLSEQPEDIDQFKTSLEEVTMYYNGITGRTTLDTYGDRKFASFNFWGIDQDGSTFDWKSYGFYNNATGQLVIE